MAQSLADIILHVVFSTKERQPLIKPAIESELYQYISGVCRNLDSPVIQINGVEDHIHILLRLGKTMSISQLISEIKSSSSRWIKTKGDQYQNFSWQKGYGGFSLSREPTLERAMSYLAMQKEHHKKVTFKEELIMLLKRAKISYDEKYLWD